MPPQKFRISANFVVCDGTRSAAMNEVILLVEKGRLKLWLIEATGLPALVLTILLGVLLLYAAPKVTKTLIERAIRKTQSSTTK